MDARKSSMSSLDDQDESVRIAVRALGDMRNSSIRTDAARQSHSHSVASTSNSASKYTSSPASSASTLSPRPESPSDAAPPSPAFVTRMTSIPLVGSALRVYEQGKASSRVVKYGAQMVESSVKTLSRPVIDRLPVKVNQLDEFACRQLDRLDRYRRPSTGEASQPPPSQSSNAEASTATFERERGRSKQKAKTLDGSAVEDSFDENAPPSSNGRSSTRESSSSEIRSRRGWREGGERGVPSWLEATSSYASSSTRQDSRSSTPTQNGDGFRSSRSQARSETGSDTHGDQQVAQRSRWQAVLLEAGGLSAALSEENMRRLKYCLQWLQYATAHIDAQILILREFTASLQTYPPDAPPHARRPNPISEEHMRKLADIRKDVVQTVRQVVDVVSKYAGGALPEPARATVRGFILKLPQRWACKAAAAGAAGSVGINPTSSVAERETVTAAASGTGAHRRNGQRRAAHRERGAGTASLDVSPGAKSGASSRAASPSSSPRITRSVASAHHHARHGEQGDGDGPPPPAPQVSHGAAMQAAQRILSLATESLDMMRGVAGVVKDSLDRADSWVSRFRAVGLQRERAGQEGEDGDVDPEFTPARHHHRRNSSSQISEGLPSPFFSPPSTAWNSSIPSTPGGVYTPVYPANAPSPGAIAIPIGTMSLASRYNTPKSVSADLPDEEEMRDDEDEDAMVARRSGSMFEKSSERTVVRVAGVDRDLDDEQVLDGQKMDVDS